MFLISFATVLFTLSIWKLLSFFIMPSLFFDLLFVGFPIGAFIGVKFFSVSLRSFQRTLGILQAAMLLSIGASLSCKHFDYLRAHLFDVHLGKLLVQMGTFTVFFVPFFCAYGLSEYVGYQLGTRRLKGRMRWVYAVYLFGAAVAYLSVSKGLELAGTTGMIGLALVLVAAASLLLARAGTTRILLGLEMAALIALVFLPGTEPTFLRLYKGHGIQSTWEYETRQSYEPRFQQWGRYSLTEILYSPQERQFAGFYNDIMQWEYSPSVGFSDRMLGILPIHLTPRGGKIAIIGAGGGRQVKWALQNRYSFEKVVAIELEPAVFEAVRGPLASDFGGVYEKTPVQPVLSEARTYMEETAERFDLIYLPSVGGYPQMMLEPGNMIRTWDAYRTLRNRLTDHGILAIWYPSGLDRHGILTRQYVRTLRSPGLDLETRAYYNPGEYLILAARGPQTPLPTTGEIDEFLRRPDDPSGLPPINSRAMLTAPYSVEDDPDYRPITDDQPFLAGNVRNIFSLEQLYTLFGIVGAFLVVAGLVLFVLLRRSGDPGIPGRTYVQVSAISLLIGANFILFEHYVILRLFKKLYVFQDALLLGAISFLVLTGLGSFLITPRLRGAAALLALAALVPLGLWPESFSPETVLALTAPVALVTGSFFPAVFELAIRNPLAVFAMDAVGAALGSALGFFIPIAFGFSVFFPVAALGFVVTCGLTWWFCRGLSAPDAIPTGS